MKIKDLYLGDWFYIKDAEVAFIKSAEGYFCFYSTDYLYTPGYKYSFSPSMEINYLPIIKQDWWRKDAMLLFSQNEKTQSQTLPMCEPVKQQKEFRGLSACA